MDRDFNDAAENLNAALDYTGGTHNLRDIYDGILSGDFQFWKGERSAVVTELVRYPRRFACRFFLAGGDLEELIDMEKVISEWAKDLGCDRIEIAGRRGWLRSLNTYKESCMFLARDLNVEGRRN